MVSTEPPPPLPDPADEQARIDQVIDELFDANDEGVRIFRGLDELSFGETYIDEETGERFDEARLAAVYVEYASQDWYTSGGDIQYVAWFEIIRMDTSARADRLANWVAAVDDNEIVRTTQGDGEDVTIQFIPDLPGPRPSFSEDAVVRGLRIVWPGDVRTEGLTVVEVAAPYVLTFYAVSMPKEQSVTEMLEVVEEVVQPLVEALQSLQDTQ